MVKIIMHGCNGKMGQVITGLADRDGDVEIVAGVDPMDSGMNTYPVFPSIDLCDVDADVIIDFASAKAVDALLDYSVRRQIPVVLCTTGLSEEQLAHVKRASASVAVLKSANMSLGINVISKLLKEAARTLADAGFDIEIVEKHHNQKIDAPSGTAIMIANAINETLNNEYHYVYDRHARRMKRDDKEIGMHSIRGGTIVGEHDVIFAGKDEVITLSHSAASKTVFAVGAVNAAVYLCGKPAGLYDMKQLVQE